MKRIAGILGVLAVAGAAAGCGGNVVSETEVETKIKDALTQKVGQAPDAIDCPDDLKGEVGATMRCTLTAGGATYGLTVNVTSVEGDTANFDIKVDDTPASGGITTAK